MKKIFVAVSMLAVSTMVLAQEGANELKNFRFGLKVAPLLNWYSPEGKILSPSGLKAGFGGGLVTEFRLAKVVCIQTGAQIDIFGGKLKYNNGGTAVAGANTVSYYYNNLDDEIVHYDPVLASSASHTHYQLNERNYQVTYITIPVTLKLKTPEIGSFTYYGQIGMNNSFRWKASANDELQIIDDATNGLGAKDNKSKVDITKDVSLYTAMLNFGLGAEMNLAGTTSLVFGLNYNMGFTNVVKNDSEYLNRRVNDASYSLANPSAFTIANLPQQVKASGVVLTVGVLF